VVRGKVVVRQRDVVLISLACLGLPWLALAWLALAWLALAWLALAWLDAGGLKLEPYVKPALWKKNGHFSDVDIQ
jgi:hypothetical protein